MAKFNPLRVLGTSTYDDRGYQNEESLANLGITYPVEINSMMTYLYGKDNNSMLLSFLTEGQGRAGMKEVNAGRWTWKTMGRMKYTDMVTYCAETGNSIGKNGTEFEVHFATHLIIEQYGLVAPDGKTMVRVQKDLGESAYGYAYLLVLTDPNPNAVVNPELLQAGKYWSMSAPTVSESYSKGNRSNVMGFGKMTNQLETFRHSKEIAGNYSTAVTNYSLSGEGGSRNLWINEDMRQFNIHMRVFAEERYWIAKYNARPDGTIALIDRDNKKPVPHMTGVLELASENAYDTYGETLPLAKIKRLISDTAERDTDNGVIELVLSGGKGFLEDFSEAIKSDAKDSGFVTPLGEQEIKNTSDGLEYGGYFKAYRTIDGHRVTTKHAAFFDKSTIAEAARQNGQIHPRTGYPICSHSAVVLDFSGYDGNQNIQKVYRTGRAYKTKVFAGLAQLPASWGISDTNLISTEVDMASLQIIGTRGLHLNTNTKMVYLESVN